MMGCSGTLKPLGGGDKPLVSFLLCPVPAPGPGVGSLPSKEQFLARFGPQVPGSCMRLGHWTGEARLCPWGDHHHAVHPWELPHLDWLGMLCLGCSSMTRVRLWPSVWFFSSAAVVAEGFRCFEDCVPYCLGRLLGLRSPWHKCMHGPRGRVSQLCICVHESGSNGYSSRSIGSSARQGATVR
jgi:hypothetical protein